MDTCRLIDEIGHNTYFIIVIIVHLEGIACHPFRLPKVYGLTSSYNPKDIPFENTFLDLIIYQHKFFLSNLEKLLCLKYFSLSILT